MGDHPGLPGQLGQTGIAISLITVVPWTASEPRWVRKAKPPIRGCFLFGAGRLCRDHSCSSTNQSRRAPLSINTATSRLRCLSSLVDQGPARGQQVPQGGSMTMMGYFKRCRHRSLSSGANHDGVLQTMPQSLLSCCVADRSRSFCSLSACAIGLRRVPPRVLIVPRPFPAKAVAKARWTSITMPTIA